MDKDIGFIISQPEGQYVDFRVCASASMAKDVVAFANTGGGTIVVGVGDNRERIGVSDVNRQISQIETIARNCDPSVLVKIDVIELQGKTFLITEVPDSTDKPHSCSDGFFLRSGANSQKMTRNEVVEFLYSTGQVKWDEKPCSKFQYPHDFDENAFRFFIDTAGISAAGMTTEDILINIGVAQRAEGRLVLNNAGVLFFAREPIRFQKHAVVDCLLFQGTDKVDIMDRKEQKGNLMENVKQAIIFLKQHLSVRYEIKGLKRKELLEIPENALRESVLNAVMHRDYNFDSAWVSIEIYRDRVEISDPGGLPPGMKFEDLGKKSVHRNKTISDLFHRLGDIEKAGSGINRMNEELKKAGLPDLRIAITGFYTLTFDRVTDRVTEDFRVKFREDFRVKFSVSGKQLDRMTEIVMRLANNKTLIVNELAKEFNVSVRTIHEDLGRLKRWNVLKFEGAPKNGSYILTAEGKKLFE